MNYQWLEERRWFTNHNWDDKYVGSLGLGIHYKPSIIVNTVTALNHLIGVKFGIKDSQALMDYPLDYRKVRFGIPFVIALVKAAFHDEIFFLRHG